MGEPVSEFPGPLPRGFNRPFERPVTEDTAFSERPMTQLCGQTPRQVIHEELRLKRGKQELIKEKPIWNQHKDILKRRPLGAYVVAQWDPEIPYVEGEEDDKPTGRLSKGSGVQLQIVKDKIVDISYSLPQADSKVSRWRSLLNDPEWKDYERFYLRTKKAVPTTAKIAFAIAKAKRR